MYVYMNMYMYIYIYVLVLVRFRARSLTQIETIRSSEISGLDMQTTTKRAKPFLLSLIHLGLFCDSYMCSLNLPERKTIYSTVK